MHFCGGQFFCEYSAIIPLVLFLFYSTKFATTSNNDQTSTVDVLYAKYLLSSEKELPPEQRHQLRRLIFAEHLNEDAVNALNKIFAVLFDQNQKENTAKDGINWENQVSGELTMSREEFANYLMNLFMKLKTKVKGGSERDLCYFWTLCGYIRDIEVKLDYGKGVPMPRKMLPGVQACDRLDQIRASGQQGEDGDEQRWLFASDLRQAQEHFKTLAMLLHSPGANRKLSQLFDAKKGPNENELTFRLRMIALYEKPKEKLKNIPERLTELVGGKSSPFFSELVLEYRALSAGIDWVDWLQFFYSKIFTAESELQRRKAILLIEQIAYIIWLGDSHRMHECANCEWAELRQSLARFVDYIEEAPFTESDIYRLEFEASGFLTMMHRFKEELEKFWEGELNGSIVHWTVTKMIQKSLKKGGRIEPEFGGNAMEDNNMKAELEQMHLDFLTLMVRVKREFRQTLQGLNGVVLVHRMADLLGNSQRIHIGLLVRGCREKEGYPDWFRATHSSNVDRCPEPKAMLKENYYDNDALELVESYEQLFEDEIIDDSDEEFWVASDEYETIPEKLHNMGLTLEAAIWLFNAFIDELFVYADSVFGFGKDKQKDVMLLRLWWKWADVLIETEQLYDGEEERNTKFCTIYYFLVRMINTLWVEMNEPQREALLALLNNLRWAEIPLIERYAPTLGLGLPVVQCDAKESEAVAAELNVSPNFELIHSLTLYRLIKRVPYLQHFFCHQSIDIVETKNRLLAAIESLTETDWLERMFPEILRIDQISHSLQIFLYQHIFTHNSWSLEAQSKESRIVVSLLLRELDVRLSKIKVSGQVGQMIEMVKGAVYKEVDSFRSVCLLLYLDHSYSATGGTNIVLPTNEQLVECEAANGQIDEFSYQWDSVQQKHLEFLAGSFHFGQPILAMLSGKIMPGVNTRIKKLLGPKCFAELWEQFKKNLRDPEVFNKDTTLTEHYLVTLFRLDGQLSFLTNKIAADLIVFVRWFDGERKLPKLQKIWEAKKVDKFEWLYDELFDADLDEDLAYTIYYLEELFEGLKKFLNGHRNFKIENKLAEEWENVEEKAEKNAEKRLTVNRELISRMPKWILGLHAKTLQRLIFQDPQKKAVVPNKEEFRRENFEKELRKGLEPSVSARRRLLHFMELGEIRKLFRNMGIQFVEEQFWDNYEPPDGATDEEGWSSDDGEGSRKTKGTTTNSTETKEGKKKKSKNGRRRRKSNKNKNKLLNDNDSKKGEGGGGNKSTNQQKAPATVSLGWSQTQNGNHEGSGISQKPIANGARHSQSGKKGKQIRQGKRNRHFGGRGPHEFYAEDNILRLHFESDQQQKGIVPKHSTETAHPYHHIRDIKSDKFLMKKYHEFVSDPCGFINSGSDRTLMDLAIYSNEIWHRVETIKQLSFGEFECDFAKKWEKLESRELPRTDKKQTRLVEELHGLLRGITVCMGGGGARETPSGTPNNEKTTKRSSSEPGESILLLGGVIGQLHRNKLAKAIITDHGLEQIWAKLAKVGQIEVITSLLDGKNGGNRKNRESRRREFFAYLEQWKKVFAQKHLDHELYKKFAANKYLEANQQTTAWRSHIEHMQQIKFSEESNLLGTEEEGEDIKEYGFVEMSGAKENEINVQIRTLRNIVDKWSKGKAKLLVGGSVMLRTYTKGSDIDTLCIVPEHIQAEHFFGTHRCNPKESQKCESDAFFCQLCEHHEIHSLQRIPTAWVPMIRLILTSGLEFEMMFASIPGEKKIQIDSNNVEKFEEMILRVADRIKREKAYNFKMDRANIDQMQRTLRSLAGYHSNLKMLELVQNSDNFRKMVRVLKHWARSTHIYSNMLGFLNGTSVSVLAAKVVLLYPDASVTFLLERFFFTYTTWEWPLPVQLDKVQSDKLSWNPAEELRERKLQLQQFGAESQPRMSMPVITPGYPQQSSSLNMNAHTAKVIRNTMQEALKLLHSSSISTKEKWQKLLQQRQFQDMYAHFFTITCAAADLDLSDEFCGFVGTTIRSLVLASGDCIRAEVQFCHARSLEECPEEIMRKYMKSSPMAVCRAWLIGIELKSGEDKNKVTEQISSNLRAHFDEPIVESYRRIVLGEKKPLGSVATKIKNFLNIVAAGKKDGGNWAMPGMDFVHLESEWTKTNPPR